MPNKQQIYFRHFDFSAIELFHAVGNTGHVRSQTHLIVNDLAVLYHHTDTGFVADYLPVLLLVGLQADPLTPE